MKRLYYFPLLGLLWLGLSLLTTGEAFVAFLDAWGEGHRWDRDRINQWKKEF